MIGNAVCYSTLAPKIVCSKQIRIEFCLDMGEYQLIVLSHWHKDQPDGLLSAIRLVNEAPYGAQRLLGTPIQIDLRIRGTWASHHSTGSASINQPFHPQVAAGPGNVAF